jgi:hypothetical protein
MGADIDFSITQSGGVSLGCGELDCGELGCGEFCRFELICTERT